jgi:UrcA family protein
MNTVKLGAAGLAIAVAALIIPATVQAAQQEPVIVEGSAEPRPAIRVSFADLNLANKAGLARLNSRVAQAADRLCIEEADHSVATVMAGHACRRSAVAGAEEQISRAVSNFGNPAYAALTQIAVTLR